MPACPGKGPDPTRTACAAALRGYALCTLPALAATGHEAHGFAASRANGEAELFLPREWQKPTGTSPYRANTHFFGDEVRVPFAAASSD